MKILITGATGLIGKSLGIALVRKGHEVVAISRSKEKANLLLPFPAEIFEWKSVDDPFPAQALRGVQGVIHLMGENIADHRWTESTKKELTKSRVLGTRQLIQAIENESKEHNHPIDFFIHGSAIGYYGESHSGQEFNENSKKGSGFLADLCSAWEAEGSKLENVRTVILRTGVVASHQGGAFLKMIEPIQNGVGGRIGTGNQRMSLIHLEDLVSLLLFAIENKTMSGVINGVCESVTTQAELVSQLCKSLGKKEGPAAPSFALHLMLGEMASIILGSQAVVSSRLKEFGFKFRYPDVNSIIDEVSSWYRNPFMEKASSHLKYEEQYLDLPIEKVLSFFSEAKNLERITPDFLNFKIKSMSTSTIEKNSKITYQLKLHGFPIHWLTDIAVWNPPYRFVDNQLKGPYSLWYHEHRFETLGKGTLMKDWVRYQLPLGVLGSWVAGSKVKADVASIFNYRRKVLGLNPNLS